MKYLKQGILLLTLTVCFMLNGCKTNSSKKESNSKADTKPKTGVVSDKEDEKPINNIKVNTEIDPKIMALINNIDVKEVPYNDSTDFFSVDGQEPLNEDLKRLLSLSKVYNPKHEDEIYNKIWLRYRVDISDNFNALVISHHLGTAELETQLVTYTNDYKIIDFVTIAYDEVAESCFRKKSLIEGNKITVTHHDFCTNAAGTDATKYIIDENGYIKPFNYDHSEEVSSDNISELTDDTTISFSEVNGQAVIIGEEIIFKDEENKNPTDLKEGDIVELKGLSDSLYQNSKDYCDASHYVRVGTASGDRIVDGRNVYKISDSDKGSSFTYKGRRYTIKTTEFFGIGVVDEDGLTFCSKYQEPVVLIDEESDSPKLINMVKNDIYKEIFGNGSFGYFELMNNDGASDDIQKIDEIEDGVILNIKRGFQEGWNEFQIKLTINESNSTAEYLNYGEVKYDY